MKEKIFRMLFLPGNAVELYEEYEDIWGRVRLRCVCIVRGVEYAKERARELCPRGYKLRLLNIQREHLDEIYNGYPSW